MPPLDAQTVQLLWWLSFFTICIVIAMALIWRTVALRVKARNIKRLASMRLSHERLQTVVSELLAQVNDLDQHVHYLSGTEQVELSHRLKLACENIVHLGNTLPFIDELIKTKRIPETEEGLLQSCRLATSVSQEIQSIRAAGTKLIGDNAKTSKRKNIGNSSTHD